MWKPPPLSLVDGQRRLVEPVCQLPYSDGGGCMVTVAPFRHFEAHPGGGRFEALAFEAPLQGSRLAALLAAETQAVQFLASETPAGTVGVWLSFPYMSRRRREEESDDRHQERTEFRGVGTVNHEILCGRPPTLAAITLTSITFPFTHTAREATVGCGILKIN